MEGLTVDAGFNRHPHLLMQLTHSDIVSRELPPCELEGLFGADWQQFVDVNATQEERDLQGWKIMVDPNLTDVNGWRYSNAWNTSTWESVSGPFDVVRKR